MAESETWLASLANVPLQSIATFLQRRGGPFFNLASFFVEEVSSTEDSSEDVSSTQTSSSESKEEESSILSPPFVKGWNLLLPFVKGFALEALEAAAVLVCFLSFFKAFAPFSKGCSVGYLLPCLPAGIQVVSLAWVTFWCCLADTPWFGQPLPWLVLAFFFKVSFSLAASLLACLALEVMPSPLLSALAVVPNPSPSVVWHGNKQGLPFFKGCWEDEGKSLFTKAPRRRTFLQRFSF